MATLYLQSYCYLAIQSSTCSLGELLCCTLRVSKLQLKCIRLGLWYSMEVVQCVLEFCVWYFH